MLRSPGKKVCTVHCGSFTMNCMVASSIPCKLSLCADRAHARAGDSYVSSAINVACPTTQSVLAIASPHELHGDSWPSSSTGTSSFCCNQQYSVYALTDSSGNVSERYAYSAYGEPTVLNASGSVISSSAINNRYSYTGREWDATVGLYHFRARWMSGLTGRFLTRDPMKYKGSPWDLYEFVDSRALHLVDPLGLHGGGGYICCGGRWIHTHQFGCCNNVPFEKSKQCCENGQIVNKVPIWKTTFPVFQDPYLNNVSCGWNIVCPLSWVGWNLVHAVICLDGPTSGCIGVNDVTDRVENQDYMLQNAAPDPDDIVSTKHMVCPRERDRIRNSVGQPWNHGYIFGNCHHWSCANGVGVW